MTMPCTIPSPSASPVLRALLEHAAAAEAIAPLEPLEWQDPQKAEFIGNRHERRAQAAIARRK
jgi:hypothetical protein